MKTTPWDQHVLLVSDDTEVQSIVSGSFGENTHFHVVHDSERAVAMLEQALYQVIIIDSSATDRKLHYSDDHPNISFLEL